MTAINRRQFITHTGLGALATGISRSGFQSNTPALDPSLQLGPIQGLTDPSLTPNTTHLGDNWVDITFTPTSKKVIESFEICCELDGRMHDQTGAGGIGAYLNLNFFTGAGMQSHDAKSIEISPWTNGLNSITYIDTSTASPYSNWTVTPIKEVIDPLGQGSSRSGLFRMSARRTPNGYDCTFSWIDEFDDYSANTPESGRVRKPQTATFLLPIKDIYGFTAGVHDRRDFRGDSEYSSLFPFATGIHHLNEVDGTVALTRMATDANADFEQVECTIVRSGAVYDAALKFSKRNQLNATTKHVLWVEPNAHELKIETGITVGTIGEGEYAREALIDSSDNAIFNSGMPALADDYTPTPIKSEEHKYSRPVAIQVSLGNFSAKYDFAKTVAIVKNTRELTWVAPTINSFTRCADIVGAVAATESLKDKFPAVADGPNPPRFTPIELFTGCVDLKDLEISLYQEEIIGEGEGRQHITTADLRIQGDDLYLGKVVLPRQFDLTQPINCMVGGNSRVLSFVREPYPVITPAVPVICKPGLDKIV